MPRAQDLGALAEFMLKLAGEMTESFNEEMAGELSVPARLGDAV